MNNYCYTFLAEGVKKVANPHLESSEEIRVHFKSQSEIKDLLMNGSIIEAVMQAPLWRYIKVN